MNEWGAYKEEDDENMSDSSNITISIHSYDDIFNNFDPRAFSHRSLSSDFLADIKRGSLDKSEGKLELRFLIPREKRNAEHEQTIKSRLREHFHKHLGLSVGHKKKIVKQGSWFVVFGAIAMLAATTLLVKYPVRGMLLNFIEILLEPGGWYFFWQGLDLIIFRSKEHQCDLDFYKKMARAEIVFSSH